MFGRIFAELQPPDAWGFQFAGPVVTWDAHITSSQGKRLIWISIASIEICGFSVRGRGPVRGVKYLYCLVVRLALRARRGSGLVPRARRIVSLIRSTGTVDTSNSTQPTYTFPFESTQLTSSLEITSASDSTQFCCDSCCIVRVTSRSFHGDCFFAGES
jgi:hypothetical protein